MSRQIQLLSAVIAGLQERIEDETAKRDAILVQYIEQTNALGLAHEESAELMSENKRLRSALERAFVELKELVEPSEYDALQAEVMGGV